MYDTRGAMGFSVVDLPLIGRVVNWADDKIRDTVEAIVRRYAEFERAAMEAPAITQDAVHLAQALRETGGTPAQVYEADRYVAAARKLEAEAANRGPVDKVVEWARMAVRATGMGALPAAPLWLAGTAAVAIGIVASTIKQYNEAKLIRAGIAAGMTPDQLAKLAVRRSPFSAGLFGATSAVTLGVLAVGAFLLLGRMRR